MNFFKRKFSFGEEEGEGGTPVISYIANKVSTISAPTSPARTGESLATALERSLAPSQVQPPPLPPDAKVLLVIDGHLIDWNKYFRTTSPPIRVEQADFHELDLTCTENNCTVEIVQPGKDARHFTPHAVYVASGASGGEGARVVVRSLLTANVPFLNSRRSVEAFLYPSELKKELRGLRVSDGTRIPFLPSIHYPNFHKFNATSHFPIVVSVGDTRDGEGKIKVNSGEELLDLEGILRNRQTNTQVEVEPFVECKYDLHVQKIASEYKTFLRRGISRHWRSNAVSSILEQVKTTPRHIEYLSVIGNHLGGCPVLSMDILLAKDGREFVHSVSDTVRYFGESQEEDRRAVATLLHNMFAPPVNGVKEDATVPPAHPQRQNPQNTWNPQPVDEPPSFADDTMGQLKRTFAGIFGEV